VIRVTTEDIDPTEFGRALAALIPDPPTKPAPQRDACQEDDDED
jgi:hypothetical protein